MRIICFSYLLLLVCSVNGQDVTDDFNLLMSSPKMVGAPGAQVKFKGMLKVYQNYFSDQIINDCIYEHSCSTFSQGAITEFGLIKGGFLSIDRLMRCNRASGLDFVPSYFNQKIIGQLIVGLNIFLACTVGLKAQSNSAFKATLHFKQIGEIEEGLFFIKNAEKFGYMPLGPDSSAYLLGKFYYHEKRISESINHLIQVKEGTVFYDESALFAGYQYAYVGDYGNARNWLSTVDKNEDQIEMQLKHYLLSGLSLLERNLSAYDDIMLTSDFKKYRDISPSSDKLSVIRGTISEQKSKSALRAGLLSAVLPGLGHMYVGNIGRGAMTLVTTGIFGLQAWESYRKDGVKSVRFAIFGSLFSGFYIANIYGSAIGVRLHQQQINDQINESILVTMHVPLRYIFD
jgi:putative component of membrane protein insertase Oxa1/YidC/SpoIIIJ protein YidD/TM2 domain-containing membrane protein YozV